VQLPDDETFASFQSESNQLVVQQLKHYLEQIAEPHKKVNSLYLFGLAGVGKSHLLHASCVYADKLGVTSLCLSFSELTQLSVDVLEKSNTVSFDSFFVLVSIYLLFQNCYYIRDRIVSVLCDFEC